MGLIMADTAEILSAAHKLGGLVATHPIASGYKEIIRQLDLDVGAKQLLQQYEQLIETLAMKEQQMQPIEVAEKQQFERLQQSIAMNATLKKFASTQAEYMDFMRKVQDTINAGMSGQAPPPEAGGGSKGAAEAGGGASKIILET
jgi:cell fate (sporulation/competence/biofilm development) regulator YlbF (YheA/YmcA/DUF963 family)